MKEEEELDVMTKKFVPLLGRKKKFQVQTNTQKKIH